MFDMNRYVASLYLLMAILLAVAATLPAAGQAPAAKGASNGQALYEDYCASCHGRDAKGDGPAARALKTPPIDLTLISKNHAGNFPEADIRKVITGQDMMPSHGTEAMPVWGKIFAKMGDPKTLNQRVDAVIAYLRQIQAK